MTKSMLLLITFLITANLTMLHCHEDQFHEEKDKNRMERPENRLEEGNFRNNFGPNPPPQFPFEEGTKSMPYRNNDRDGDNSKKNRHKHNHHHGRSGFLEIMGIVFLIIAAIGVLFGTIKLINRFFRRKNMREYNQWKEFKRQMDLVQESRNDQHDNNVNRNHANLNNPPNQNINNSGCSYVNLGKSMKNDFNNPY